MDIYIRVNEKGMEYLGFLIRAGNASNTTVRTAPVLREQRVLDASIAPPCFDFRSANGRSSLRTPLCFGRPPFATATPTIHQLSSFTRSASSPTTSSFEGPPLGPLAHTQPGQPHAVGSAILRFVITVCGSRPSASLSQSACASAGRRRVRARSESSASSSRHSCLLPALSAVVASRQGFGWAGASQHGLLLLAQQER